MSQRFLAAFLDEIAPGYDDWSGGLNRRTADRLVEMVAPQPGEACLDMCAGTGLVAAALSERVGPAGSVVSIDISERMVETARRRARANTHVALMAADDVYFRDATFDLLTVGRSLAYMTSPTGVLAEAHRVLRPGGRVALFCRRRSLSTAAERAFLAALGRLAPAHPIRMPDHLPELSDLGERDDLDRLLVSCGLSPQRHADMIMGGHATDATAWNELMMGWWPAARFLIGGLGPVARAAFEADLDAEMAPLGDDAYRYHHPYLFVVATRS